MRTVVYSITARDQLRDLLLQGISKFGPQVVAEKRDQVFRTVENLLALHPATKRIHPAIGLVAYPISATPFVVLYDFDDAELRVHFVVHRSLDVTGLDPGAVEW